MTMRRALFAGLIAAQLCAPAQANATSIDLPRNGGWVINYAEDKCHLVGEFGTAGEKVTAVFIRNSLGDTFDLRLVGKPLWSKGKAFVSQLSFGPQGSELSIPVASAEVAGLPALLFSNLRFDQSGGEGSGSSSQPDPAVGIRDLSFTTYTKKAYRLKLGSMRAPMQAMQTCLADLMQKAGYDAGLATSLRSLPVPTGRPGEWVTVLDFPTDRMKPGTSGFLRFKLDVDVTGRVTGCEILEETKGTGFASLTCALLMRRARFQPAVDIAGKQVKAPYINTVRWAAGP